MNNTITLSQLITRLASSTGVDNNSARRFLRAFFAAIEDALAEGQTVSIKGIGTFRPVDNDLDGGKLSVSFTPDEAIATELNRPFEMFDAVELADDIDFADKTEDVSDDTIEVSENLEPVDDTDKLETIDLSDKIETVDVGESLVTVDDTTTDAKPVEDVPESKDSLADRVKTILWPEEEEEKDEEEETIPYTPPVTEKPKPQASTKRTILEAREEEAEPDHKKMWIWGGIAIVAVAAIAYLAAVFTTPVDPVSTMIGLEENAPEDSAKAVENTMTEINVNEAAPTATEVSTPPQPKEEPKAEAAPAAKKEPVYDTVEISLIRLAKKHYGEGTYWVFIYEANRDIISNPNRIRPGQKVVIPDRSTFPGSNIAETKAIAKRKQSEILDKFK